MIQDAFAAGFMFGMLAEGSIGVVGKRILYGLFLLYLAVSVVVHGTLAIVFVDHSLWYYGAMFVGVLLGMVPGYGLRSILSLSDGTPLLVGYVNGRWQPLVGEANAGD